MNAASLTDARRFAPVGAILAPILLVMAIRGLLGGVSQAPAAPTAATHALGVPQDVLLHASDEQRRAAEWSRRHTRVESGASPMERIEAPAATIPASVPSVLPEQAQTVPTPESSPLDSLKLTSIIGRDQTGLVAANGHVHRFGEELEPGWKITMIDARARVIDVTNSSGTVRRLSLDR